MQQTAHPQARLGFPLFLVMALLAGFLLWLALSRSYSQLEELTSVEATAKAELNMERTRSVELLVTRAYVDSFERISDYQADESWRRQEGEILMRVNVTEVPYNIGVPDVDELSVDVYSRPWQMWWQLLTDQPMPSFE